jgi:putative transposase
VLTSNELLLLSQRLGLSSQAQAVLGQIRSSPPSRRVGSGGKNVPVRYPSRKMGLVIQAESRTVEFAGAYEMEHDPTILEFWDQPSPPITLHYPIKQKNGRTRVIGVLHTPDYFVIREDTVGWEEWKTEEELLRFASAESTRYVQDEQGKWRCPPGEAVATPLGFYYHVRSSAEIDQVFQRNLRFLSYYLREEHKSVQDLAKKEILALVTDNPGIQLSETLKRIEYASPDDLYRLIATEDVYIDVYAAPLAEPERLFLFCDEETSCAWAGTFALPPAHRPHTISWSAGAPIVWDGRPWTILNTGETTTALLASDGALIELPNIRFQALVSQGKLIGLADAPEQESLSLEVRERLRGAGKEALQEANRRYRLIKPVLDGQASTDNTSSGRAMRRWIARYRQAAQAHGCGYVGVDGTRLSSSAKY